MLPLLAALLVLIAVLCAFVALWRLAPRRDPVADRLTDYGQDSDLNADADPAAERRRPSQEGRLLNGFGVGSKLALSLSRADLSLTVSEFSLIVLGAAGAGLLLGLLRGNLLLGVLLAILCSAIPFFYLRMRQARRLNTFTQQLPDFLTLVVGALRAGYGLNQALGVVVDQMPPPLSSEVARVLHAVGLGVPMHRALTSMAARMSSDDFDLVVTAITVQYELGGNLAATLDNISDTVRQRLRILREIQVLTAQQRFTGYVLALFPVFLVVMLSILSPGYFAPFLAPGPMRVVPVVALLMLVIGFLMIRRVVDIKV